MEDNKKFQDHIEDLKKELGECQKLRDEYLAGWQRQKADFLNFKRDQERFLEHFAQLANEKFILDLLPSVDHTHLSIAHLPEELRNHEWVKGAVQSMSQLFTFLKTVGIEEIKTVGERFNPEFHEAVQEVEDPAEESGIIIEEVQKGYTLHGRVVRPAKVKISK